MMPSAMDIGELEGRARTAAGQLKMVQISFGEESGETRKKYLAEVVSQLVNAALPHERAALLQAVEAYFPVWGEAAPLSAPAAAALPAPPPPPPPPPETPEQLADRLVAMATLMDEEDREGLRARLSAGRILAAPTPPPSMENTPRPTGEDAALPKRMREAMQFLMREMEIEKLDFTRMIKLVLMMTAYVGRTEQLIWSTWRAIAPQSELRRARDLHDDLRRYLSGDKEIAGVELNAQVETMQKLIASIVAAVGQAGKQLARQHLARFHPQEIETQANRDGVNPLISQKSKCWDVYVEMARDLEEETIEHAVKEILAQYVEAVMKRSG
jgi:hypothetical protein